MVSENSKKHVVVAMSGGVDSSVCAALLVEQGYRVSGIMMRLWSEPGSFSTPRDNRCCTRDQMIDAHFVARKLGIPFEVIDARDVFREAIVESFIEGHRRGITPNPCLSCNRKIRFTFLLNEALKRGADFLATGHYAQVSRREDGIYELRKGADEKKDQSYVLSVLNQKQLSHAMFPVGGYSKPEVREQAERFGLPVASKQDSQDLCFIADGDYRRFLQEYSPEAIYVGEIQLTTGETIGEHSGLPHYTIGQRKGLGIAYEEPLYVIRKDTLGNRLIVGTRAELGIDSFGVGEINWLDGSAPEKPIQAAVKIRYKSLPVSATVTPSGASDAIIRLDTPLPDVTPGQGAVVYSGNRVVASGIILEEVAA